MGRTPVTDGAALDTRTMRSLHAFVIAAMAASVALAPPCKAAGRRSPLIYRGDKVEPEEYPFEALVCSNLDALDQSICEPMCTGSLVSPGVVLTAAHCFSAYHAAEFNDSRERDDLMTTKSYGVVFGGDTSGPHHMKDAVRVKKIVMGDDYDLSLDFAWDGLADSQWSGWSGDLALVFLDECDEENDLIKMLAASDDEGAKIGEELLSHELQILGWGESEATCVTQGFRGLVDDIKFGHDRLQVMDYELRRCSDLAFCDQGISCDTSNLLCFSSENIASCRGDSGGPIFLKVPAASAPTGTNSSDGSVGEEETIFRVNSVAKEATTTVVQVGILSAGMVVPHRRRESLVSVENSFNPGFVPDPSLGFTDESVAAMVPAYTQWLKKHLETDTCLERAGLAVDDLFVDASVLTGAWD